MKMQAVLGQFIPGNSVVHRLDARFKLALTAWLVVVLFFANSFVTYGVMLFAVVMAAALSRIKPRMLLRALRPMLFLMAFTLFFNVFLNAEEPLWWSWWKLSLGPAGLRMGLFMGARLMLLVTASSLLTFTTSPLDLTDGLERLLNPLKVIKFPAHELAMMMSIALRFIPTLAEEVDRIIKAQQARGADFESGNIIRRAKALVPVLVPLFASTFRRAEDLAMAMEARCYQGGEGRTRMKVLKSHRRDWLALAAMALLTGGLVICRIYAI